MGALFFCLSFYVYCLFAVSATLTFTTASNPDPDPIYRNPTRPVDRTDFFSNPNSITHTDPNQNPDRHG